VDPPVDEPGEGDPVDDPGEESLSPRSSRVDLGCGGCNAARAGAGASGAPPVALLLVLLCGIMRRRSRHF
jgi:hypothetical protein